METAEAIVHMQAAQQLGRSIMHLGEAAEAIQRVVVEKQQLEEEIAAGKQKVIELEQSYVEKNETLEADYIRKDDELRADYEAFAQAVTKDKNELTAQKKKLQEEVLAARDKFTEDMNGYSKTIRELKMEMETLRSQKATLEREITRVRERISSI